MNGFAHAQPPTPDPYVPIPLDTLPAAVRDYVPETAASLDCDPAAVAVSLLPCLAGAVGGKRILRLPDGRCEQATIWTGVIGDGDSASRKAFEAGTAPARRKQLEAFARHDAAMRQYHSDLDRFESIQTGRKDKHSLLRFLKPPAKPTESLAEHRVLSHVSPTALVARLPASPDGLLMLSDELAGWIARCSSREEYLAHMHAMWSGEPLIRELAKKTVLIERPSVSMAGRIRLESLSGALAREHNEDAPITRLLVAMPPPPSHRIVQWPEAAINPATEAKLAELFDKLWALDAKRDANNRPRPVEVELSPEAHGEWILFRDRHRVEQAEMSGYLAAVSGSLESYALRFALVLHLCRWAEVQAVDPALVDAESLRAAVRLAGWFGGEARRVHAVLTASETADLTERTLDLVRRKGGRLTARQLQQFDRRFHNDPAGARAELERLAESGQGHWETGRTRRFVSADGASGYEPQPYSDVQM